MANPGCEYWVAMKRVFRYFIGSFEYSICYHSDVSGDPHSMDIQGYVDSDWVEDVDRRRYTRIYMFQLFFGEISWMRK
jgi:hypothetical protein